MTRNKVRDLLRAAADPSFKEFNDKIVNCDAAPSLGIRVPKLREIAAKVVKSGWQEYVREMEQGQSGGSNGMDQEVELAEAVSGKEACGDSEEMDQEVELAEAVSGKELCDDSDVMYQEEHMLWGMILGKAKMTLEERTVHLNLWVPGILSWADCDTCVSAFKFMKKDQEFWYAYCVRWLDGGREFEVRFALVALMQYFVNDEYIARVLLIFAGRQATFSADTEHASHVTPESKDSVVGASGKKLSASPVTDSGQRHTSHIAPEWNESTPYYIKMAAAWALSVCFVKYRDLTWEAFASKTMNPWVQNKAIQKCRESYRVSAEDKELLKSLKR